MEGEIEFLRLKREIRWASILRTIDASQ